MSNPRIIASDIEAAERLLGVAYTAAERELMVGNPDDQIEATVALRGLRLPNSAPPASRFDPRLPNFAMPPAGAVRFTGAREPLPVKDEDIAFAPVTQLSAWIAAGAL